MERDELEVTLNDNRKVCSQIGWNRSDDRYRFA